MPKGITITWSKVMVNRLKRLYSTCKSANDLATYIGVPLGSLKAMVKKLGLRKTLKTSGYWYPYMDDILRTLYADHSNAVIAKKLKLTPSAVATRAFKLGLKKSEEFMLMSAAKTSFRKGHVPANKGKKMPKHVYEKAKKAMFKKGQIPVNAKGFKVGDISLRENKKRGTLHWYIRLGRSSWYPLHQYLWSKENGPQPKGHCVSFIDGDTLNCELSNLELITMAENYRRNSAQNRLTDRYVAFTIVGRMNTSLIEEVLKDPKLIEAKRQSLILNRLSNERCKN